MAVAVAMEATLINDAVLLHMKNWVYRVKERVRKTGEEEGDLL